MKSQQWPGAGRQQKASIPRIKGWHRQTDIKNVPNDTGEDTNYKTARIPGEITMSTAYSLKAATISSR